MRTQQRPLSHYGIVIATPLLCALAIGGLYLAYEKDTGTADAPEASKLTVDEGGTTFEHALASRDGDGDGLYDWEEGLWNTDPESPDSDGDGVPDGAEVQQGRDPVVAGVGSSDAPESLGAQTLTPPDNTTEAMGKEFMASYLLYKQTGTLDEAATKDLLTKSIARGLSGSVGTLYTGDKLSVAPDASEASYLAYQRGVEDALAAMRAFGQSELVLLGAIVEKKDEKAKDELAAIAAAQQGVVDKLLLVPVPQELAPLHLQFINNVSMYTFILETLSEPEKDPLRTLMTTYRYEKVLKDVGTTFDEISRRVHSALT